MFTDYATTGMSEGLIAYWVDVTGFISKITLSSKLFT